jgi:hypothetical protein
MKAESGGLPLFGLCQLGICQHNYLKARYWQRHPLPLAGDVSVELIPCGLFRAFQRVHEVD